MGFDEMDIEASGGMGASEAEMNGVEAAQGGAAMGEPVLLWIDLEMTGLDPVEDRILEVAAIATGFDLEPRAEYTAVVKVDEELMRRRMVGKFWDENPEAYAGLVAQNAEGKPVAEVEKELLKFVNKNCKGARRYIYLAGNSIHQDRRFIEREMPRLNKRLHYRMLDVSAWKLYFENVLGVKFEKPEAHRALDDIKGSIGELGYYLSFIKPIATEGK